MMELDFEVARSPAPSARLHQMLCHFRTQGNNTSSLTDLAED